MPEFRILRQGVSLGVGTARQARDEAIRGDILQNVTTLEKFAWWPELGGHEVSSCPYCTMEKNLPKIWTRRIK